MAAVVGLVVVVGLDGNWLDFILGDVWYVLKGLRGGWYVMSVRRKSNILWGCAWDVKSTKLNLRRKI